jgi:hypothetical protein
MAEALGFLLTSTASFQQDFNATKYGRSSAAGRKTRLPRSLRSMRNARSTVKVEHLDSFHWLVDDHHVVLG